VKALIHLVPRGGAGLRFDDAVASLAAELRERSRARGLSLNLLTRLDPDPFGARTPYRATLEIAGAALARDPGPALWGAIGDRLDAIAHPDRSTLLLGEEVVFVASQRAPVRYQYLMRRNASFSHADYLDRYRRVHSRFGSKTPGILGYVQFHVDRAKSRRAAYEAGLGVWGVDSVSELHLDSLEVFLREISGSTIGPEAIADEERFVDRARSEDFCSRVDWSPES